jgi:hypothetical protein
VFGDGSLTFQEFMVHEPLPLATIQDAVLEFLRDRDDAVLFGAQAVNAYVEVSRLTEDVDILSTRAAALAEDLREYLASRFHIAVRIREIGDAKGFRIYQLREPKNRHLVDLRPVSELPPTRRVEAVLVVAPHELIATKVIAFHSRQGQPKSFSDRRDLAVLLLSFPELKRESGPVRDRLLSAGAGPEVLATWREIAGQEIVAENDEDEFA